MNVLYCMAINRRVVFPGMYTVCKVFTLQAYTHMSTHTCRRDCMKMSKHMFMCKSHALLNVHATP